MNKLPLRTQLILTGVSLMAVIFCSLVVFCVIADKQIDILEEKTGKYMSKAVDQETDMLARITAYQLSKISGLSNLEKLSVYLAKTDDRGGAGQPLINTLDYCKSSEWDFQDLKKGSGNDPSEERTMSQALQTLLSYIWHKVTFNESIEGVELVKSLKDGQFLVFRFFKPWGAMGQSSDCPIVYLRNDKNKPARANIGYHSPTDLERRTMSVYLHAENGLLEWGKVTVTVNAVRLKKAQKYTVTVLDQLRTGTIEAIIAIVVLALGLGMVLFWWIAKRITDPLLKLSRLAGSFGGKTPEEFLSLSEEIREAKTADSEVETLRVALSDLADKTAHSLQENIRAAGQNAVATMARGAAHELNNLLQVLQGYSRNLKESFDIVALSVRGYRRAVMMKQDPSTVENPKQVAAVNNAFTHTPNSLQEMQNTSEVMGKIVKTMLRLANAHGNNHGGVPAQVDLSELIDRVKGLLHVRLKKGIKVHLHLEGVPKINGYGDELLLLIFNLVNNAIDSIFIKNGIQDLANVEGETYRGDIHLSLYQQQAEVVFEITDTGMGLEPGQKEQLFNQFYTTKREQGGTGLGLATCLDIVKMHHGTIEASGEPGKGATFTVRLPR